VNAVGRVDAKEFGSKETGCSVGWKLKGSGTTDSAPLRFASAAALTRAWREAAEAEEDESE